MLAEGQRWSQQRTTLLGPPRSFQRLKVVRQQFFPLGQSNLAQIMLIRIWDESPSLKPPAALQATVWTLDVCWRTHPPCLAQLRIGSTLEEVSLSPKVSYMHPALRPSLPDHLVSSQALFGNLTIKMEASGIRKVGQAQFDSSLYLERCPLKAKKVTQSMLRAHTRLIKQATDTNHISVRDFLNPRDTRIVLFGLSFPNPYAIVYLNYSLEFTGATGRKFVVCRSEVVCVKSSLRPANPDLERFWIPQPLPFGGVSRIQLGGSHADIQY